MKGWMVRGRFIFDGEAYVEANTAEEAKKKFDEGDFEFQERASSCVDWEKRGEPDECV